MCYGLPPNGAVGGRRWTLFCKELVKRGHEVHGIGPEPYASKTSSWEADFPAEVQRLYLPIKYPSVLSGKPPKTLIDKVKYRLALKQQSAVVKGNIYDPTSRWDTFVDEIVTYLNAKGINNLIVSGAPFHYFNLGRLIKQKQPNLNLILEYRDLWTDSTYEYGAGVKAQSLERYDYEFECENKAIEASDMIVCASQDVLERIKHRFKKDTKAKVITNGYEPSGNKYVAKKYREGDKIRMVYAGSINSEQSFYVEFLQALKKMRLENPYLYKVLEISVYNNTNPRFEQDVIAYGIDVINFFPGISQTELDTILMESNFSLILKRRDELVNSFPSKFFDSLKLGIPIICYTPRGEVYDYLRNNNGFSFDESNIYDGLCKVMMKKMKNELVVDQASDDNPFTINRITDQLLEVLG